MLKTNLTMVLATAPSLEVAEQIANTLVAERLAACINIISGVTSIYRWNNNIQREHEVQMVLKTAADVTLLQQRFTELHPYEVPEFIVVSALNASTDYLQWVVQSTT